jgi:hypothetical protein
MSMGTSSVDPGGCHIILYSQHCQRTVWLLKYCSRCADIYTQRLKSLRIHTQRITSLTYFYTFYVNNSLVKYAINFDAVYNL